MRDLLKRKEKQLYKNKHIKIAEKGNLLMMSFAGTSSSKEYRESLLKFVEFASHRKEHRWLWDQEKMSIFPQDWEWTINEWHSMSINKLGEKRRIALIASQSFYLKYEIQSFLKFLNQHHKEIQIEIFENTLQAEVWLNSY